jgi:hypothetical protein
MCFSYAKRHMSILYVRYRKFPTNRFIGNFDHFFLNNRLQVMAGHTSFEKQLLEEKLVSI